MEKEDDYTAGFTGLDYPLAIGENSETNNNNQQQQMLSFADVMQFADFGPKLLSNATNKNMVNDHHHNNTSSSNNGNMDQVYFLKFPVLNDKLDDHDEECEEIGEGENNVMEEGGGGGVKRDVAVMEMKNNNNKRKRGRSMKTSEEVESQRMTHIAVERNRRKQMNEHLRVLRSLMPGSYVQRGDQASIIGGAIEFVRELEQLLQCLESQKRRRLYGDDQRPISGDSNNPIPTINQQLPFICPEQVEFDTGLVREETAQNKSGLADVEVKLLGFDGIIKILSRRRQGQLIKTIAALEDLQLHILHTNITTIEQTVLYSFNVKVAAESRFSAEDIASSVQQIFTFIHASSI